MKLAEVSLDELGTVSRGRSRHRPRDAAHLYGGPYPLVQTGDIKRANLYLRDFSQTYSDAGLAQSKLWPPNTLCITIAANIADTAILDMEACFPDSVIGFIAHEDRADVRYIKYLLDTIKAQYKQVSRGATQDNLSQAKLLSFKLTVPDVGIQRRVAGVLSAYDDLIENNTRRIRLLEDAARLLYEEWFVRLRFPGHEHTPINDGVPEGWSQEPIGDHISVIRGKSYRSPELVEAGGKPFVNLKCIARDGGFRFDGLKRFIGTHKPEQIVQLGDIVVAVTDMTRERRIVAHAARIPAAMKELGVISMDTVKIVPHGSVDSTWMYGLLRFSSFSREVREHATGTNVLHLKPARISEYVSVLPPRLLQDQYGDSVRQMLKQIDTLQLQQLRLKDARDLLLPRLMTGEVAV